MGMYDADTYARLDGRLREATGTSIGFSQELAVEPLHIGSAAYAGFQTRFETIRSFQRASLAVLRAVLAGELPSFVGDYLFNDLPPFLRHEFHRQMPGAAWHPPHFFRTDEASPGRIGEVQCPGSMWGELDLLAGLESQGGSDGQRPAEEFVRQVTDLLGKAPVIQHLLDNASIQHSMRYFMERTRGDVKYYGVDPAIGPSDVSYVRTHSYYGLLADNFFRTRLDAAAEGLLQFDLPPLMLFDQKATLVLPFWKATRDFFSDAVRDALIYSQPVIEGHGHLERAGRLSLDDLGGLPQAERKAYLKYAGIDPGINWGSRSVHRLGHLGHEACRKVLGETRDPGHIAWLIQSEVIHYGSITAVSRQTGDEYSLKDVHTKFSGFYGPSGLIGVTAQFRKHFKVHGQEETVIALVQP